ncbi:MAG TPA: ABC transporter permease [Trueperaceae bacterium]
MSVAAGRSGKIGPDLRVVGAIWRRELLRYARDRSQLFGAVSRTVLWLIILGFGLGAALRDIEGYTYAQYILPGVVTLNILFASLQSAIALVWDREVGLLREVLVSPAGMPAVTLGKVLGGATISLVQGSIPLLAIPFLGLDFGPLRLLLAWVVMFCMGTLVTSFGVIIASRMRTFEGFGSISNGIIQPLYFLSGSIFPLKGIVGGVGFLDIPAPLRAELRELGIFAIGSGWVVQLPTWLEVLVFANPLSYQLDLLRYFILGFQQLPLWLDYLAVAVLPLLALAVATLMMNRLRQR